LSITIGYLILASFALWAKGAGAVPQIPLMGIVGFEICGFTFWKCALEVHNILIP
jgi:hypothetical protein